MMSLKYLIAVFGSVVLFAACSDNNYAGNGNKTNTADNGAALFNARCASCHGEDGTAGIGNAANLQTSKLDSTAVRERVTNGKGAMPSFKEQLTEAEIKKLAAYVFTLRK
jgi:mono/diheme cytochrome c family protein